jgi:hypothetical protein
MKPQVHHRTWIRLSLSAYLWSFFFVCNVYAQDLPTSASGLLKNLKQSGDSCRRNELTAKSTNSIQRETFAPDLSCMISPQELLLWTKAGQSTIVDTRAGSEYAQFHIDGSINVPMNDIVRKTQLRGSTITLVGTGKLERELYVACAQLKASGFKSVKVLQGGILAWLAADQAVIGRSLPLDQLQRLEPLELFAEGQFDANLVIVSDSESKILMELNYAVAAPQSTAEGLKQVLERHRREVKGRVLNAVVWVGSAQTKPEVMAQLRAVSSPLPFLVYLDGEAAYQRHLLEQKVIWLAQSRGPKQPSCGM